MTIPWKPAGIFLLMASLPPTIRSNEPDNRQLLRDMASLELSYIPSLYLTSQQQLEPSRKAVSKWIQDWGRFSKKHALAFPKDVAWKADIQAITEINKKGAAIVASGNHLVEAHEVLEGVRYRMRDARIRNKIDYYVDYLTDFHDPMEAIVLYLKDKPGNEISAEVRNSILNTMLPLAESKLKRVESAKINAWVFSLNDSQVGLLNKSIRAEQDALAKLRSALKSGSNMEVKQSGMAIKPTFMKIYMSFGDFRGLVPPGVPGG